MAARRFDSVLEQIISGRAGTLAEQRRARAGLGLDMPAPPEPSGFAVPDPTPAYSPPPALLDPIAPAMVQGSMGGTGVDMQPLIADNERRSRFAVEARSLAQQATRDRAQQAIEAEKLALDRESAQFNMALAGREMAVNEQRADSDLINAIAGAEDPAASSPTASIDEYREKRKIDDEYDAKQREADDARRAGEDAEQQADAASLLSLLSDADTLIQPDSAPNEVAAVVLSGYEKRVAEGGGKYKALTSRTILAFRSEVSKAVMAKRLVLDAQQRRVTNAERMAGLFSAALEDELRLQEGIDPELSSIKKSLIEAQAENQTKDQLAQAEYTAALTAYDDAKRSSAPGSKREELRVAAEEAKQSYILTRQASAKQQAALGQQYTERRAKLSKLVEEKVRKDVARRMEEAQYSAAIPQVDPLGR